jgi:ribosome biogenesis ATPase
MMFFVLQGVDVRGVAASSRCDGFSGADMAALLREACVQALRSQGASPDTFGLGSAPLPSPLVTEAHFDAAFSTVMPSVSRADARRYDELRRKLRRSRNTIPDAAAATTPTAANAHRPDEGDAALA